MSLGFLGQGMKNLGYPGLGGSTLGRGGVGGFTPAQAPGVAGWYDVSQASTLLVTAGTVAVNGNGVCLIADVSGNSGVNAFCSGGAASNTATSPAKSITGNQTITADVRLLNFITPAANVTLFSNVSGNNGCSVLLLTTGIIRMTIGDGAAQTNFDSTAAMASAANTRHTIQVQYTDNTNVKFFVDAVQLGATVVVNKVLTNGAVSGTVGTNLNGVCYSLVVTGTYNMNPSGAARLAPTFVAPTTGETWTINTTGDFGARISGERDLVNMTGANQAVLTVAAAGVKSFLTFNGTSQVYKCPGFPLVQPVSLYFVGQQKTWTATHVLFDGATITTMQAVQTTGSPQLNITAGSSVAANSGLAVATYGIFSAIFNGATSQDRVNRIAAVTGNAGAGNPNGLTLGATATPTLWGNIVLNEFVIYGAAHDDPTQQKIILYEGQKWLIAV